MPEYQVHLTADRTLNSLPNDWTAADYKALLDQTEYGDTTGLTDDELRDMAYLSVADMERPEAAKLLLEYRCAEHLDAGHIQQAMHEMEEEKLWEEYPDLYAHASLFSAGSFLYKAYNGGFPKAEARELTLEVTTRQPDDLATLEAADPGLLLRLLAPGMDGHALMHRLLEDQLTGTHFPEAEGIVWQSEVTKTDEHTATVRLLSSLYWLEDYRPVENYSCKAWADTPEESEAEA